MFHYDKLFNMKKFMLCVFINSPRVTVNLVQLSQISNFHLTWKIAHSFMVYSKINYFHRNFSTWILVKRNVSFFYVFSHNSVNCNLYGMFPKNFCHFFYFVWIKQILYWNSSIKSFSMRTELKIIHALRMIESNEGGLKIKLYKYTHSSDFPKRIFETHGEFLMCPKFMSKGFRAVMVLCGYMSYSSSEIFPLVLLCRLIRIVSQDWERCEN